MTKKKPEQLWWMSAAGIVEHTHPEPDSDNAALIHAGIEKCADTIRANTIPKREAVFLILMALSLGYVAGSYVQEWVYLNHNDSTSK